MGANNIREIREERGLSQAALAERVGTSQPTIKRLESGETRLTPQWVRRIAAALACGTYELASEFAPLEPYQEKLLSIAKGLSEPEREAFIHVGEAMLHRPEPDHKP